MLDSASLRPPLKSSLHNKSNVGLTVVLQVFNVFRIKRISYYQWPLTLDALVKNFTTLRNFQKTPKATINFQTTHSFAAGRSSGNGVYN